MLRSLVALPGRSSPFSLTRRGEDAYSRTDTRLIFSSSGLPPAEFGSSSLAFLTVDWMLRRRIACPTCRADRAASLTDPSEKGKWIPGVPHRHHVGSAPYPCLYEHPVPALQGPYKLHNRVADRLGRGQQMEADAHGHTRGCIPSAHISQGTPPMWAHTQCCLPPCLFGGVRG